MIRLWRNELLPLNRKSGYRPSPQARAAADLVSIVPMTIVLPKRKAPRLPRNVQLLALYQRNVRPRLSSLQAKAKSSSLKTLPIVLQTTRKAPMKDLRHHIQRLLPLCPRGNQERTRKLGRQSHHAEEVLFESILLQQETTRRKDGSPSRSSWTLHESTMEWRFNIVSCITKLKSPSVTTMPELRERFVTEMWWYKLALLVQPVHLVEVLIHSSVGNSLVLYCKHAMPST